MQFLDHFIDDFHQKKYVLAISGGVDSMVLFDVFLSLKLNFSVAHVNYNLRGENSVKDFELVKNVCKANNIPFFYLDVDTEKTKPNQTSIQMFARQKRYDFFEEIKTKNSIDYLVTAHHFDDSLETFIINFSRGTGLKGLLGIPEFYENKTIRPFFECTKTEIINYAKNKNLVWREDESNTKTDYLRNKIRWNIILELEKLTDNSLKNYQKTIEILKQTQGFVTENIHQKKKKIVIQNGSFYQIKKKKFNTQNAFLQRELLAEFGFTEVDIIEKIIKSNIGSLFYSDDFILNTDRKFYFIQAKNSDKNTEIIVEKLDFQQEFPFKISIKNENFTNKNAIHSLDYNHITFPLKLRKRKQGDWFFPLNMIGKKKVSKFMKDEKMSFFEKENTWLLVDANDEIICIIGKRIDNRFKIKETTQQFINIYI